MKARNIIYIFRLAAFGCNIFLSVVQGADPICAEGFELCGGDTCYKTDDSGLNLVFCNTTANECQVNMTSSLVGGGLSNPEDILDSDCAIPINQCGGDGADDQITYCEEGQTCQQPGNVCAAPTPAPSKAVTVTCEDLDFCEDGEEVCVQYNMAGSETKDSECIALDEFCDGDESEVCSNDTGDEATYYFNGSKYDPEGWPETSAASVGAICTVSEEVDCDDVGDSEANATNRSSLWILVFAGLAFLA